HHSPLHDPQLEAGPSAARKQRGHPRLVHPDPYPITGHPRLGHLEQGAPYAVTVADAHLVVRQILDREVFSELPVAEVAPAELLLPVSIRIDLVHVDGPNLAAMTILISLSITVDVEPPDHAAPMHRRLTNGRVDLPPVPVYVLWESDVDRKQPCHWLKVLLSMRSVPFGPTVGPSWRTTRNAQR